MRFFVFFLGALLIVAGATSIGFGIDIIQVERGWTEVISGAMVLAAGAVIVALGCVVAKLDQVLKATERGLRSSAHESVADAAHAGASFEISGAEPAGLRGTPAPAREWSAPPVAIAQAEAVTAQVDSAAPGAGQPVAGDAWPHGEAEARASLGSSEPSTEADRKAVPATGAEIGGAHAEIPEAAAETNFEWLERALSDTDKPSHSDARAARLEDSRPPEGSGREETPISAVDPAHPVAKDKADEPKDPVLRPLPPASAPEPAAPDLFPGLRHAGPGDGDSGSLAPTAAEPAILGRYQANGNSYVMFSDGSIEAVTQTGVYRFGSMAELKAFIEAQS
jgi:hypothetical protein